MASVFVAPVEAANGHRVLAPDFVARLGWGAPRGRAERRRETHPFGRERHHAGVAPISTIEGQAGYREHDDPEPLAREHVVLPFSPNTVIWPESSRPQIAPMQPASLRNPQSGGIKQPHQDPVARFCVRFQLARSVLSLCAGSQCRADGAAGQCRNLWHDFELLYRNVSYGCEPS
jgi:hypothetical protein